MTKNIQDMTAEEVVAYVESLGWWPYLKRRSEWHVGTAQPVGWHITGGSTSAQEVEETMRAWEDARPENGSAVLQYLVSLGRLTPDVAETSDVFETPKIQARRAV